MVFVGFGHRDKLADAGVHWERGIRVFIPNRQNARQKSHGHCQMPDKNPMATVRQKSHGYCQMAHLGLAEVR